MDNRFLCRGKCIDSKEWVMGILLSISDTRYGIAAEHLKLCRKNEFIPIEKKRGTADIYYLEVDPATLGQCTGLNDKNGKLIFEGDVVTDGMGRSGIVEWSSKSAAFTLEFTNPVGIHKSSVFSANTLQPNSLSIIGNIFDNPELLEK